jgi:D-3-phosphoglycerate dehydrogenase
MLKVLITSPGFDLYGNDGKEVLEAAGLQYDIVKGAQNLSTGQLRKMLPRYDALIVGSDAITAELLQKSRVKIISKHGVGIDNIDLDAAKQRGVVVKNVPGALLENAVADFALTLILTLGKKIIPLNSGTKAGEWRKIAGINLPGAALGIVGMGRIGKNLAVKARALGMNVWGWDLAPDCFFAKNYGVLYSDLETLLKTADIVSLHVPLSDRTVNLLNSERLRLLKDGALIINTGRGGLIDEQALYHELQSSRLGGAALDTFMDEPPRDSPLLSLENVIATPHNAAYTEETLRSISRAAAENVAEFWKDQARFLG